MAAITSVDDCISGNNKVTHHPTLGYEVPKIVVQPGTPKRVERRESTQSQDHLSIFSISNTIV